MTRMYYSNWSIYHCHYRYYAVARLRDEEDGTNGWLMRNVLLLFIRIVNEVSHIEGGHIKTLFIF